MGYRCTISRPVSLMSACILIMHLDGQMVLQPAGACGILGMQVACCMFSQGSGKWWKVHESGRNRGELLWRIYAAVLVAYKGHFEASKAEGAVGMIRPGDEW